MYTGQAFGARRLLSVPRSVLIANVDKVWDLCCYAHQPLLYITDSRQRAKSFRRWDSANEKAGHR